MGASRVEMYCDEIVISDAILRRLNLVMTLLKKIINIARFRMRGFPRISSFFNTHFRIEGCIHSYIVCFFWPWINFKPGLLVISTNVPYRIKFSADIFGGQSFRHPIEMSAVLSAEKNFMGFFFIFRWTKFSADKIFGRKTYIWNFCPPKFVRKVPERSTSVKFGNKESTLNIVLR